MILRIVICLCAFLPFSSSLEAGFWDSVRTMFGSHAKPVPMIDVLIVNDQPGVMLEIKGKYQLFDPNTKELISKRFIGKRRLMQPNSSGLKWGEEFPGVFQLQIVPEDYSVAFVVDGVEYRGSLFIFDIGGTISIVNRVPIEDYLLATLPAVYPDHMPEETLAAIAITARTDAYYLSKNPRNKYWSVDGYQTGYKGLDSQEPGSEMEQAILATRHMVLSKTGAYEKVITPFPASWGAQSGSQQGTASRLSLSQAEEMGQGGNHAAQILSKAFPGTHIELIY